TPYTHIYTLSLHDALPISHHHYKESHKKAQKCKDSGDLVPFCGYSSVRSPSNAFRMQDQLLHAPVHDFSDIEFVFRRARHFVNRSEEHTSELQSRFDLVCR